MGAASPHCPVFSFPLFQRAFKEWLFRPAAGNRVTALVCSYPPLPTHKGLVVLGALGRCGARVRAEPLQLQLERGG